MDRQAIERRGKGESSWERERQTDNRVRGKEKKQESKKNYFKIFNFTSSCFHILLLSVYIFRDEIY